jgi:hypothetical protein
MYFAIMQVVFAQHDENAENETLPLAWFCRPCIIFYMDNTQRDGKMKNLMIFCFQSIIAATLVAGPIFFYLIFCIKP